MIFKTTNLQAELAKKRQEEAEKAAKEAKNAAEREVAEKQAKEAQEAVRLSERKNKIVFIFLIMII